MPLPALGAVAQFLASNGARAAVLKFGKKAVEAAKKELSDREKSVSTMAEKANEGVKKTRSPQSIRWQQDTERDKRVAKEEAEARAPRSPKEEMPLKFKDGGMTTRSRNKTKPRGVGAALRGYGKALK